MKVAVLAGGWGTRLAEETDAIPKPMVKIGDKPILWHIMMHFHAHGFSDFAIALGYKGEVIKRWMLDLAQLQGDLHLSTATGAVRRARHQVPDWHVDMIETGLHANTGGRLKALSRSIGRQRFCLAFGDGVSDVDITSMVSFHESHGKLATMAIVRPPARFGHVHLSGDCIAEFNEKPQAAEGWINGGFFVLEPGVFDYIEGDDTSFEMGTLGKLASDRQLMAFQHAGFWQCMDTLRDKRLLNRIWEEGNAPWATWEKTDCDSSLRVIAAT